MGEALKRMLLLLLVATTASAEQRFGVMEFFARGTGEYCVAAAPSVLALQDEMEGRAVILEYPYDSFRDGRVDRFWGAYSGPSPYLPLVMVGSGYDVCQGAVDYATRYRQMLESELARSARVSIQAWSRRSGGGLEVFATAKNLGATSLTAAMRPTFWLLVWEDGRLGLTKTFVRAAQSRAMTAEIPGGGSVDVTFQTPVLYPTNWQRVRSLVLMESLPTCGCGDRYDMLQAAIAKPAGIALTPAEVTLYPAEPEAIVTIDGPHVLGFSASTDVDWLSVTPPSGTLPGKVAIRLAGAPPAGSTGLVRISASGAGMGFEASIAVTAEGIAEKWSAVVPAVAHAPGGYGTLWRTDLAAVNEASTPANALLTFVPVAGDSVTRAAALPAGGTTEWGDILSSLFEVEPEAAASGVVRVSADQTLCVSSSTYNQKDDATFGGFLPAVRTRDALAPGKTGILPQLARNPTFRTNVGLTNLGDAPADVTIRLRGMDAEALGKPVTVSVPAKGLLQVGDVFAAAAAGYHDLAWATVEVTTPGALVWAYASVVDNRTGDPTNIPLDLTEEGSADGSIVCERTVPSVGHAPGAYGSVWRSDVAVVNATTAEASVEFRYVPTDGSAPLTKTERVAPGIRGFGDIVVSLFGFDEESSSSGALHLRSDTPLVISSRTFNVADEGTFGAHLGGISVAGGMTPAHRGVIPQVKRGVAVRTNVGLTNLAASPATVGVSLYAADGSMLGGETPVSVPPWGLVQINDVFAACGTGDAPIAWVRIDVKTEGGAVFAFASVVDNRTGDPTIVPAALSPE